MGLLPNPDDLNALVGTQGLGGRDDGIERHVARGHPAVVRRLRLTRADWLAARSVPVEIHGLAPCLPLFGLPAEPGR
jgi:hypothetical protein